MCSSDLSINIYIKTYIESGADDFNIDINGFLEGNKVPISIPEDSGVRVIEYKIKMPKVIGDIDNIKLINNINIISGAGIGDLVVGGYRYAKGEAKLDSLEENLKNGLLDNIKIKIVENRPERLLGRVYIKELKELDDIKLSSKNISKLKGLEKCTNAKSIDLSGNNDITDVSVLEKITGLNSLNLSNNQQVNKETLKGLTSIIDLTMDNANINDEYAKVIGELKTIESLSLKSNSISDLNNFSNLSQLKKLYLNHLCYRSEEHTSELQSLS